MTADQIRSLQPALATLLVRFRHRFKRETTFAHWERYLVGLISDLKRKSIEPIALAAGVAVRTLQEFLAFFAWDHRRVHEMLQHLVANEHDADHAIGVIDASGHAKQGDKTPGVQRQWCGESATGTTASSASTCSIRTIIPPIHSTVYWPAIFICPRVGMRIAIAAVKPAFRMTWSIAPNVEWPSIKSKKPSVMVCVSHG